MGDELKLAVVGVGRIGVFHAQHVQEIANGRSDCALSAVVDGHEDTAERVAATRVVEAATRAVRTRDDAVPFV